MNATASRLERLLAFIQTDPSNLDLIADATATALDEGRPDEAARLVDLYAERAPLPPSMVNLAGLVALQERRFEDAVTIFDSLLQDRTDDTFLRFNLAWAYFQGGDGDRAAELIDDQVADANPAAAATRVQALHLVGRLEEALSWGQAFADRSLDDQALMGALATVAMDLDKTDVALAFAKRSVSTADGLSTLGALELGDGDIDLAERHFDEALGARENSARALIGKGMVLMARNDPKQAADWLKKGAEVFGDHLGSWVALGWAQFAAADYIQSRKTFEHALGLDDTFAETHGALGALDVIGGDLVQAQKRIDVAVRLDRQCFSAILAKSLLEAASGRHANAERIQQQALGAPIGPDGRTLAQAMTALTRSGPPPRA